MSTPRRSAQRRPARGDDLDELVRSLQALRQPLTRAVLARAERRDGPSAAQTLAMSALARGPLAISELAGATGVAVSTATRMAQGLQRAGLTAPAPGSEADRRRRYVALTPEGEDALRREIRAQHERLRAFLEPLPPERREALRDGVEAFLDALPRAEERAAGL